MDSSDQKDVDKIIIDREEESLSLLGQPKRKQERENKAAISPPSKKSKFENGSSEEGQLEEAGQEEEPSKRGEPSSLMILEDDAEDAGQGKLLPEDSVTDEDEEVLDSFTKDRISQNDPDVTTSNGRKDEVSSPLTESEEVDLPEEVKKGVKGVNQELDGIAKEEKVVEGEVEGSSRTGKEEVVASQEESKVPKEEVVLLNEGDISKSLDKQEVEEGLARPLTAEEEEKLGLSGLFESRSLENSFTLRLDIDKEGTTVNQENTIHKESLTKIDSDPERPVSRGASKQKRRKGKRRERKGATAGTEDRAAKRDLRPNYFVGVKISNAEIHEAIVKIQEDLIAFEPKFARTLIDVATSHITLLVAHIDNEEKLGVAISALDECKKKLSDFTTEPIQLTFSRVGHFSNQVVYAKLVEDEHYHRLLTLATEVRQVFSSMGVCMPDEKDLHPHLTIAKTSKAPHRKGKHFPRKFDPSSYRPHQDTHFGCQFVFGLQLLSMNKPKDKSRYYHCEKEMHFELSHKEKEDHSACCFPRRPLQPSEEGVQQSKKDSASGADSSASSLSSLTVFVTCAAAALILAVAVSRLRR